MLVIVKKKCGNSCGYLTFEYFWRGELAEWSNAPVLKTGVPQGTGGSNPSFSAREGSVLRRTFFYAVKWRFSKSKIDKGSYKVVTKKVYI